MRKKKDRRFSSSSKRTSYASFHKMKSSCAPLLTLAALVAAAAAVVVGGVLLAQRDVIERERTGREELGTFAGTLSAELRRLETAYEQHLTSLAESLEPGSEISLRTAGRNYVGLSQISIIPVKGAGIHALYPGETQVPVPVVEGNTGERKGLRELVSIKTKGASGWQGNFFYFKTDNSQKYVVLTINPDLVSNKIEKWVAARYAKDFEPVATTGATVQIDAPAGTILAGDIDREPDFVLPMKTRFGRWRIAAWDNVSTTTTYHIPTLVISSAIALGLALGGLAAFVHLRRWSKQAEQRVSFVNRVSHEMRTPLTNILLNIDLADQTIESAPAEASRRMTLVREESERLGRLIANVLTFSRGEKNTKDLQPTPVGLENITFSTLAPFEASLRRRGIKPTTEIESGTTALADPDACTQILGNLISNVEKYAASGKTLEITGGVSPEGVWLFVNDNGPGIPSGAEKRIFRAFERLGSRTDEGVTGTGLGLTISRDLANKMGGDLTYERQENGSRFILRLPAAPDNIVTMPISIAS